MLTNNQNLNWNKGLYSLLLDSNDKNTMLKIQQEGKKTGKNEKDLEWKQVQKRGDR